LKLKKSRYTMLKGKSEGAKVEDEEKTRRRDRM
jgi:hypothetical protein